MSHELRTPLNAIIGYSQLMQRETSLTHEQRDYLETIGSSGEHLLALINDVLDISKIEAKKVTLNIDTFDLHGLINDLKVMFISSMEARRLHFELIGIDKVPRYVISDRSKLRQVLVNLLDNAIKFTPNGGITLRMERLDAGSSPDDNHCGLRFEVQDTGVGIVKNEQDRLFRYFEQTASGRRTESGSGLGLAISRDYVRMMGGDITVTSKEGEGSLFSFEIVIREGRASDIKDINRFHKSAIGIEPSLHPPRILVAEDKDESRILLVKLLQNVGFEVQGAANGLAATEVFRRWRPDFIWMDIRMPVMDGYEATRRIRAMQLEAGESRIPIVALTAHALKKEREQILASGCTDVVRKPFHAQEIFAVMEKHLGLTYVYQKEPTRMENAEVEAQVSPDQLAALPLDLKRQFYNAVVRLDIEQTQAFIEQLAAYDAQIAAAFQSLADNMQYHRILACLENETASS
jgi:CheY-like chemotaxis protein